MCERVYRGDRCRRGFVVSLVVSLGFTLALAGPSFAQAADQNVARSPRFAVGGGALLNTVVCIECEEPNVAGFSGGFEFRFNDDWSVIGEGLWTEGYEVWTLEQDGVTYPSLTHDYFAFLNVKFRWQFSNLRHRPYLVFGGAARWHQDTEYQYAYRIVDRWWEWDVSDVDIVTRRDTRGAALFGFGWSFKLGDRVEIRPEADLYIGRFGYANVGITGWYNF